MSNDVVFKGSYKSLFTDMSNYFDGQPILYGNDVKVCSANQLGETGYYLIFNSSFSAQPILTYGVINKPLDEGSIAISNSLDFYEITCVFASFVKTHFSNSSKKYQRSICIEFGSRFSEILYNTIGNTDFIESMKGDKLDITFDQISVLKNVEVIEESLDIEII